MHWFRKPGNLLRWWSVSDGHRLHHSLHATLVSVFVPGCFALLHMFVFHMVRALHCKSAPPRPPSWSLWPCLLERLWGYHSPISARTWLQRGLPLCRLLFTSSQRLCFQTWGRLPLSLIVGLRSCHKVALGRHAAGLLPSIWNSVYLIPF